MRSRIISFLAATTYLAVSARALPHPASPATYNVVDVGGPTDAPTESATGVETVKTTLTEQTTYTEVVPAATITTTPQPIVSVQSSTSTTSSSSWTVVIGEIPTTTSSSSTTCSSTSSASTRTTSSQTAISTADDGLYHPTGDDGQYRPFKPAATPSASTTVYYAGAAATTGWAQPWNATGGYAKRA